MTSIGCRRSALSACSRRTRRKHRFGSRPSSGPTGADGYQVSPRGSLVSALVVSCDSEVVQQVRAGTLVDRYAATPNKTGDCINRNLEICQKPDTLNTSFDPALPHYGAPFPLPGEQEEPVKPRCMCELFLSRGVCCVRSACRTLHTRHHLGGLRVSHV
jgi:hypothetical protein